MNTQVVEMKKLIDQVEVVSFDIFDTLVKRYVNTPESVFELVGQQFGIFDFAELRQRYQNQASQKAERELKIPHADIDQIYKYISGHEDRNIDWEQVKEKELEIEEDCLYCNQEMYEIYRYALDNNKRVIVTSDMYLKKEQIERILKKCGYDNYASIYISSEINATKYTGDIFKKVCEIEGISGDKILHIGDNLVSDYENARKNGWNSYLYKGVMVEDERKGANPSLIDYGVAQAVMKDNDTFWYDLGVLVGGPLYMGLCQWMKRKVDEIGYKKVFFLARDGYNLYQTLKEDTHYNAEYLYMSRRALLLAGITELDEETLQILPPFTWGQTVREVLEYLGVEKACGKHLAEAGIESLDDVINSVSDMQKVRQLYLLNADAFLKKCEEERAYARAYFQKIGFFTQDNIVFDCGWNGSSQYLLERFLNCVGYAYNDYFLYVGIMDTEKSRRQLKNKSYDTYLFDYSTSRAMQNRVKDAIVLFELFFGAPEQSVYCYDSQGVVFEQMDIDESYKLQLCEGIKDYISTAKEFVDKYNIKITKENAISGLIRLINAPTMEEAKVIGNLKNVDGFAKQKGVEKYIAKLDYKTYKRNPNIEIYWPQGLLKRDDIAGKLKKELAKTRGIELEPNNAKKNQKADRKKKRHFDNSTEKNEYDTWMEENEKDINKVETLAYNPLFSLVIPVYNVVDEQLIACIESVKNQTYKNWELRLVDDASSWENVRKVLGKYSAEKNIFIHYRSENGHISKATNDGIERARGEFIAFMDCDDVIAPNALYEMAKLLNQNPQYDFIYSDEDKLTEDGKKRHSPFFKPDWSPDTFMSLMYTNHLAIYRKSLVEQTGGLRSEFNGAQDYDFTLRFMELTTNEKVGHVAKVLYHWRERGESIASTPKAKPYALEAMKKAKEEALLRRGYKGRIEYVSDMYQYRVVYKNDESEKVSIIIPSKDNVKLLFQCIEAIKKNTAYENYEILVIDNGSSEENRQKIEVLAASNHIDYYYEKMEFNFSKMCNLGAQRATGQYLLFLNDDIEVFNEEWLSRMVGHASLPYIGAVGAKLLYPDSNIIQHVGITNLKIGPSHNYIGFSDGVIYYFGRNRMEYNSLAVTAACLIVEKNKFAEVGGFDENLTVAYNDVDLCFKLYEAGYYNVIRNDVSIYHHESASRGSDDIDPEKKQRLLKERKSLYDKHQGLVGRDPFYNENLTQNKVDFSLNIKEDLMPSNRKRGRLIHAQKYETTFTVIIDRVSLDDKVLIKGWFFWRSDFWTNHCRAYLALRDIYGHCTYFELNREVRIDVAESLGNNAFYSGFQCSISYADLRLNKLNYQIGILVEAPFLGIKRLCWTGSWIKKVADSFYSGKLCEYKVERFDSGKQYPVQTIDEVDLEKGVIRGWALNPNSLDNDFDDMVLVYQKDGDWFAKEVVRQERLDVAANFINLPNATWSGFVCNVDENDGIGNIQIIKREKEVL